MVKRSFKSTISLMILTFMMIMSISVVAAAGTDITNYLSTDQQKYIVENITKFSSTLSTDTKYQNNDYITMAGLSGRYYIVDGKDGSDLKKDVEYYMDKEKQEEMTNGNLNIITNGLRIFANIEEAVRLASGFSGLINVILGIIVVGIAILMAIYTGFDIVYIAFPAFRSLCDDAMISGNSAMTRQGSNGQTKLRFVTDEAQKAVEQSVSNNGGGKNPWMVYLSSRIVSYIFVAIILYMFMTGNINIITNIAVNAVSGIMKVLQNLQF